MEMTEILDLAGKIGQAIKESDEMKEYEQAQADYQADEALQKLVSEFNVHQQALAHQNASGAPNQFIVESAQTRLNVLYEEITKCASFVSLTLAEQKINDMITKVNHAIMHEITGEDPDACTHDCSTCGGCH